MTLTPPTPRYRYERNGRRIYDESFATIRSEIDARGLPSDAEKVAVRMVHACGQVDLVQQLAIHRRAVSAARDALRSGAPVLADAQMVASGVTRARLPADNEVVCTLRDTQVPSLAKSWETTRSAAAVSLWAERMAGSVVVIGNAPTALFHLLELLHDGAPRPAAIIGVPVGFVGAAESKEALIAYDEVPYIVVRGRRGGSAMAASAVNALAREAE